MERFIYTVLVLELGMYFGKEDAFMEFKSLRKVHAGQFIDRYDLTYETADGKEKVYEMISRDHELDNPEYDAFERLNRPDPDSVILIVTNEEGDKLLISKEYRMACGDWVYNFVAGLIDAGESPIEAARRELREETGLELVEISDVLERSISAIGFSNEKNVCVFGKAAGEFQKSTSTEEEIEPGWYSKEEVKKLLHENYFAARTQAYCYLWANSYVKEH